MNDSEATAREVMAQWYYEQGMEIGDPTWDELVEPIKESERRYCDRLVAALHAANLGIVRAGALVAPEEDTGPVWFTDDLPQ
jgi:hypothetical protein